jgi:hypothetical protein
MHSVRLTILLTLGLAVLLVPATAQADLRLQIRNDTLEIFGDADPDRFDIRRASPASSLIHIDVGNDGTVDHVFDRSDFSSVVVRAGDGDDVFGVSTSQGNPFQGKIVVLSGEAGDDEIIGSSGTETVQGNEGDDVLSGFTGNDTVDGGPGDDTVFWHVTDGNDTFVGGTGSDTLVYQGGNGDDVLELERGTTSPRIVAGNGASRMTLSNVDHLVAQLRGGADTVRSDPDMRSGGLRTMLLAADGDAPEAGAAAGDDVLQGSDTDDTILAGDGADELGGGAGSDVLRARGGDDMLDGGDGADELDGGDGADTMRCDAADTVKRDDADTVTGACAAAGPPVVAPPAGDPPAELVPPAPGAPAVPAPPASPAAPVGGAAGSAPGLPGAGPVRGLGGGAPGAASRRALRVRARAVARGLSVTITAPGGTRATVRITARERIGRRTFRYAAVRRRLGANGRLTVTLRAPRALRRLAARRRGSAVVTVTDVAAGERITTRVARRATRAR